MNQKQEKILQKVTDILTQCLEKNELRKTPERYAILQEIYSLNTHFSVEDLHERMKTRQQRVSRATLYNCLELLLSCELIRKHHFSSHQTALYEKAYGNKQHDHLICTDCKRIVEFCDPRLHHIKQNVGDFLAFDVIHHSFLLYGKCQTEDCTYKK